MTDPGAGRGADAPRLRLSPSLAALVGGLHPELKRKVRAGLDLIRDDPSAGKALRGDLAGLRSLRVGRFRIIYRVASSQLVELIALGPRRTIYAETLRAIRRDRGSGRPPGRGA